ncbi:MAG: hypothetical protein AMXMBFR82_05030 [Candidatus Hydrogenedentota bacterium]
MSARGQSEAFGIYLRVAGAIAFIILAGIAGLWLGGRDGQVSEDQAHAPEGTKQPDTVAQPDKPPAPPPPLYLYTSIQPGADLEAVVGEVTMAAKAGIHDYVFRVALPWPEQGPTVSETLYPLDRIEEADPSANILLAISLNPPDAWLAAHPEAASSEGVFPSVTSERWLEAGRQALSELLQGLEDSARGDNVVGLIIGALEEDRWRHPKEYDRSETNRTGFRSWLRTQYPDGIALAEAWGDPAAAFESVEIPPQPDTQDRSNVFFNAPDEQMHMDYLRYVSESTADALSTFSAHVHQGGDRIFKVLVPYGYSFEYLSNASGHCALALLLDGVIDGFVSPVSYVNRALGGAGGFMGPVDSVNLHGKQWFIVDDTRTGISRNATTGEFERIEGLRVEDVLNVQRRNFAGALAHGLGLFWADPDGVGALHEPRMWESFGRMRSAYQTIWSAENLSQGPGFARYPTPEQRVGLTVVVDEPSRFHQRCDEPLNTLLLTDIRDAALSAGVPVQFCLLQDVLDGRAAPSLVYVFNNSFHLHEEDRTTLQNMLIEQNAAAIWMYASGYISGDASAENISKTTGHTVRAFEGEATAGSTFQLDGGKWLAKGEAISPSETWSPLFYIETDESKAIARYRESERTSVAVEFFEEGWASIYVAEPTLSADLLREILSILEEHVFVRPESGGADVLHFGPAFFAIHAGANGEREIDLGDHYDVQDMLDPNVGWLDKRQLTIPMKTGDTHVLHVSPPAHDATPDDSEEAPGASGEGGAQS